MDDFDHILNWKLKAGSHPFPGKDGGTCINEGALVAVALSTGLFAGSRTCRSASRARSAVWRCN